MDNKKQVLYISYDGMTDPLGQSQVLPYLTQLSKYGYKFTLISCEKEDSFKRTSTLIQEICDANEIEWHPLSYTKSPPILSTLKDLKAMRKLAFNLHEEKAFSIIHCRSYISALIGLEFKKKGIAFLFDMRGLWANEKVDAGAWNLKNPLFKIVYKYYKKKEQHFFNEADYTISLTEAGRNEIHGWKNLKNNPVPIQIIPCCVDTAHFSTQNIQEEKREAFCKQLGIEKDDFVLSYLGSIGTWYMLDEMLDFFVELLLQRPESKFLFITGDEHTKIKTQWAARNLPAEKLIIIKGERKDVPTLISLSDFSIFFIQPYYSKVASSPTKQGEIMAMGIPIVCNSGVGDTSIIVKNYRSGIVINNFTQEDYKGAVAQMKSFNVDKEALVTGANNFFGLDKGVQNYLKVYKQIEK